MKKYFASSTALFLLALSLSGCVWYGPHGWHGGYDHGYGGYGHPSGPGFYHH